VCLCLKTFRMVAEFAPVTVTTCARIVPTLDVRLETHAWLLK